MNINFNMDINVAEWAKAIGYKVVGDKIVKEFKLSDFEEAIKEYIESMLDAGWNSNAIEQHFFVNDKNEFKTDFEYAYETIKED